MPTLARPNGMPERGPLLSPAYRGPGRVALDLWRARGSFRGFVEFAVIGAIVLWFLMNRGLPGLGDIVRVAVPAFGTSTASQAPIAASADLPTFQGNGAALPLAPRPSDVAFGESYFDAGSEPLRTQLVEAWRAYRARQYQGALEILNAADPADPRVLLVRGVAMIALSGAQPLRDGVAL